MTVTRHSREHGLEVEITPKNDGEASGVSPAQPQAAKGGCWFVGADRFDRWFRNRSSDARTRVQTRIDRVELGNLRDHKRVGEGVYELRIDFGPSYRVYYRRDGEKFVILLVGSTKKRQSRDMAAARNYRSAYMQKRRNANKRE